MSSAARSRHSASNTAPASAPGTAQPPVRPATAPKARLLDSSQVDAALVARSQQRQGFDQEYPFASHWFRVEGHVQHYIDEGSGPVLLMVHGNPTWSFAWRQLIRDLRTEYRVIAVDHLGCGFSEKPQQRDLYTLNGHIRRLTALVDALQLQQVTLFGHDWGGAIGMGCAVRRPQLFRRFVLMNTAAFLSSAIPRRIAACRIPWLGEWCVRRLNLFSAAALRMAAERRLSPAARAGLLAPYDSWEHRIAVHEFVQDIPLSPGHRSYDTLAEVQAGLSQFQQHPLLLVWGLRDWCFTPAFYEEFRRRFPQAVTCPLPDAGHYVFEDAHAEMLPMIRAFLQQ